MYKIIGADQKEYGPSSAEELRQWIQEGRVNGQTPVKAEGSTEWKPLALYPELASALGTSPLGAAASTVPPIDPSTLPADINERDFNLDIGSCIGRGWELLKSRFWEVVGISFLVTLAIGTINQVFSLFTHPALEDFRQGEVTPGAVFEFTLATVASGPVQMLFMGGLYRYYLKLMRGESAEFGDAFSGFNVAPVQLLLLGLVQSLLILLGFALCILPGIYFSVAWCFAVVLVIDKRMDFWPAMELSRKVVSRHWFVVFGLLLVNGLLAMAGVLACCVGVFVTLPLALLSLMFAYEDIFGHRGAEHA